MLKRYRFLIVILLLAGFPLISYIYLKKGLDFRMDVVGQIDSLGTLPLSEPNVTVFSHDQENTKEWKDALLKLNEQFGKNETFDILMTADSPNCYFTWPEFVSTKCLNNSFYLKEIKKGISISDHAGLTDTAGTILGVYDLKDDESRKLLIRHISVTLPIVEKRRRAANEK